MMERPGKPIKIDGKSRQTGRAQQGFIFLADLTSGARFPPVEGDYPRPAVKMPDSLPTSEYIHENPYKTLLVESIPTPESHKEPELLVIKNVARWNYGPDGVRYRTPFTHCAPQQVQYCQYEGDLVRDSFPNRNVIKALPDFLGFGMANVPQDDSGEIPVGYNEWGAADEIAIYMPYYNGGNLASLAHMHRLRAKADAPLYGTPTSRHREPLHEPFIWHVVYELMRAYIWLQYGFESDDQFDAVTDEDCFTHEQLMTKKPRDYRPEYIAHRNIDMENILLDFDIPGTHREERLSTRRSYQYRHFVAFPRIVLGGWSQAISVMDDNPDYTQDLKPNPLDPRFAESKKTWSCDERSSTWRWNLGVEDRHETRGPVLQQRYPPDRAEDLRCIGNVLWNLATIHWDEPVKDLQDARRRAPHDLGDFSEQMRRLLWCFADEDLDPSWVPGGTLPEDVHFVKMLARVANPEPPAAKYHSLFLFIKNECETRTAGALAHQQSFAPAHSRWPDFRDLTFNFAAANFELVPWGPYQREENKALDEIENQFHKLLSTKQPVIREYGHFRTTWHRHYHDYQDMKPYLYPEDFGGHFGNQGAEVFDGQYHYWFDDDQHLPWKPQAPPVVDEDDRGPLPRPDENANIGRSGSVVNPFQ
ncbi:hypothetical protein QBC35DRAFT_546902 [Podospora australis]|uniref:Uncharacterized protein n=1 Tax=Podospora australis TaxID=1536484 RepID=A0AAN6WLI1_9PEZI|nr:hypothetical protein QBC35DRAFT_546902 [Podospora australis]